MFVPALAFDVARNRVGHGKGYYDRYLKDYKGIKVGVIFDEHLHSDIPFDDNDIKMDIVITDKRTIK